MHMLVSMYYCIYMFSYGPYGPEIKHYYYHYYYYYIICNSGKDDKDIMRQCQQLYARGNALFRKFHMCSMSVKIQLFNTYCSPMYTAQLWWNHTVASFHRLNVAYIIS